MKSLKDLQENWETFAQTDPLWSICADPQKRGGQWQESDFFASGRVEIATVLQCLRSLGLQPDFQLPVLDFGCGVGRLTRALAEHFEECWGVDIAPTMIEKARTYHRDQTRCRFHLNATGDLKAFADGHFGMIYSSIVLQHMEETLVRGYLAEFARVLRPGGILVFQIADTIAGGLLQRLRSRIALRTRIRRLLSGSQPISGPVMAMHCVTEKRVRSMLAGNLRVVDVRFTNSTQPAFNGNLLYLDREPQEGIASKQYVAIRSS
jgi:2-polyprenyl-3-methyl-5-hydroxy-6-metoxy-1,4-benzoquinol methylase